MSATIPNACEGSAPVITGYRPLAFARGGHTTHRQAPTRKTLQQLTLLE